MTDQQPQTPLPNGHDPAGLPPPPRRGAAMAAIAGDGEARENLRRMVEETPRSLRQIAIDLAVPSGSLHRFVAEQNWTRPPDAPKATRGEASATGRRLAASLDDAGAVMGRLIGAVDRQVAMIEQRLRKQGAALEEKDARILGNLAKTLATLMALERDGGAKPDRAEPPDRGHFRAILAQRIAAWAAEEEESGHAAGEADGA